jgi:5-hydroxyisourate hydrolase
MGWQLHRLDGERRVLLKEGRTNADGRTDEPLLQDGSFQAGLYELAFDAAGYFQAAGSPAASIWTTIPIRFEISDAADHYHVPLLLAPGGYSTYRGS